MKTLKMEDMNWPDIRRAMDRGYTAVVVGIGSIEQHGPHLPTKTDTLIADMLALRFAQAWGKALQGRTIPVGCSEHHLAFPGTISIKAPTLKSIIADYTESLAKQGFETIIYLPSHGGNFAAVKEAIQELQAKFPELNIVGYTDLMGLMKCVFGVSAEFGVTPDEAGAHAGENETSLILAFADNLVKEDRFEPGYLGPLGGEELKKIIQEGMPALSKIGVLGDPTKASAEKGAIYLEKTVRFLVQEIKKQLE